MTAQLPTRSIFRNADWIDEIRLKSLGADYDLEGCEVEASIALVPGEDENRVTASITAGTIDPVQVTGPEAVFVIRVPNAAIAALPLGNYAMDVRLTIDGDRQILARGIRIVSGGVTP